MGVRFEFRAGYSLLELVVVVLIIGILAAVAVPRLVGTSATATDNTLKRSLSTVRDAIDRYAADHGGALPGADNQEATFKADLAPYLRREFPECPVGAENAMVDIVSSGAPLVGLPNPGKAWKYSRSTGEFIVNYNGLSGDGATTYDEF